MDHWPGNWCRVDKPGSASREMVRGALTPARGGQRN